MTVSESATSRGRLALVVAALGAMALGAIALAAQSLVSRYWVDLTTRFDFAALVVQTVAFLVAGAAVLGPVRLKDRGLLAASVLLGAAYVVFLAGESQFLQYRLSLGGIDGIDLPFPWRPVVGIAALALIALACVLAAAGFFRGSREEADAQVLSRWRFAWALAAAAGGYVLMAVSAMHALWWPLFDPQNSYYNSMTIGASDYLARGAGFILLAAAFFATRGGRDSGEVMPSTRDRLIVTGFALFVLAGVLSLLSSAISIHLNTQIATFDSYAADLPAQWLGLGGGLRLVVAGVCLAIAYLLGRPSTKRASPSSSSARAS